jgi:hypothetical protein
MSLTHIYFTLLLKKKKQTKNSCFMLPLKKCVLFELFSKKKRRKKEAIILTCNKVPIKSGGTSYMKSKRRPLDRKLSFSVI